MISVMVKSTKDKKTVEIREDADIKEVYFRRVATMRTEFQDFTCKLNALVTLPFLWSPEERQSC